MQRSGWRSAIDCAEAGNYGMGSRSFFVSGAKCQAPELECQAPQAKTLRAEGRGLRVFAPSPEPRTPSPEQMV